MIKQLDVFLMLHEVPYLTLLTYYVMHHNLLGE